MKACPLCEREDRLLVFPRRLFDSIRDEEGNSMIDITCERCHVVVQEFPREHECYDEMLTRVTAKWDALPRWKKVCVRFEVTDDE